MKRLTGRTAILTGASRGIGPTIADELAAQGVHLVLVARSAGRLQQEAQRLHDAYGVRTLALPADLADPDTAPSIVARATQEFGPIDILINNAGAAEVGPFARQDPASVRHTLLLDLAAPVALTRAVLPGMLERGEGHIVHISTILAKVDSPYNVSYAAAKAGLTHFSRSLRAELRGSGVSSSSISPGLVGGAGMGQTWLDDSGLKAPRLMGTVSPQQVAAGVLKAIRKDKAEVLVGPPGSKLLTQSPGFASRLFGRIGAWDLMRRLGEARTTTTAAADAVPERPAA